MPLRLTCSLLALVAFASFAAAGEPHEEPPVSQLVRVVHSTSQAELSLDALIVELAKADVVFLGETHVDETTHRFEQEVYRGLIEARKGRVVLAMEMFSRDVQGTLDSYIAGDIDEAAFLENSRPWSNYKQGYRPLIETAKAHGLPVIGSNSAPVAQRKIARGGEEAFKELTEEERGWVAEKLNPPSDEYWRRVENATRGHRGMLPTAGARTYSTQSVWDNTMGESVARALAAHPGWLVLHVNGGFHSQWHDGTARQVALRAPDATIRTVAISSVRQPGAVDASRIAATADWQALVTARATDSNEGSFGVSIEGELRYKLRVPKSASAEAPVPLLIWLPDDGPPAADELALWRRRLGDEAAIVVVEQQWREQQDDLSMGGRWSWPTDFREDISRSGSAVEEIWAYVARHHAVDPKRTVVAGEGVGACVAVTAFLYGDLWEGRTLAIAPRKQGELRDLPVPLPEGRVGPMPDRGLTVLSPSADSEWWEQETADYREVGMKAKLTDWPADRWARLGRVETEVREALGLAPKVRSGKGRAHVMLEHDSPLARNWARRVATAHEASTGDAVAILTSREAADLGDELAGSTLLPTRATAEAFSGGQSLPHAKGPFGGTTLVVLDDDLSATEVAAWKQLEKDDPLNAQSRFLRLRTATLSGEWTVDAVLTELKAKRRTNVLIVPAAFAAGPDAMRGIREVVRAHEDDMTIEFRPGLGAAIAGAPKKADGAS